MLDIFAYLVAIAGILMSLGHFPQAYKIWRKKSAKDISLLTYSIFALGSWVWLAYGIMLHEWPIIASFIIAVIGTTAVLALTLKYRT